MGDTFASIATLGLSNLFKPKETTPPPAPKAPAAPKPADSQAAASRAARHKKAAQTNTIFSSPLGIGGQAQIARKTLTGQ